MSRSLLAAGILRRQGRRSCWSFPTCRSTAASTGSETTSTTRGGAAPASSSCARPRPPTPTGSRSPAGEDRPGPRDISNAGCAQSSFEPNARGAADYLWQWGQFVDHDIDLTGTASPEEALDIAVPTGDPYFDPDSAGDATILFDRSVYDPATGTGGGNPRQQLNQITAFLDASQVYGSDPVRAAALRTNDGTGKLAMSRGRLLPFNTQGLPNAMGPDPSFFLGGDVRANEQVALTAMHTLFVREHNLRAGLLARLHPELSGDEIYDRVRAVVGAEIQIVTYNEFLPMLLGPGALKPYEGYDPGVNPGIATEFSTAAFRVGHTMLSPVLQRLRRDMSPIPEGNLPLRDAFFAPQRLRFEGGLDPILRGLAFERLQELDLHIVDDVRNFLFGAPGAGGFDLASLNIQRGRDHGLADYNLVRQAYGLDPVTSFAEITSNPDVQRKLEESYGTVDDIDLWIGGLAEDHVPGAMVGETFFTIILDQFERLRDGDRFWYQRIFSGRDLELLESSATLAKIIRRNTHIGREIPDSVFFAMNQQT